MGDTEFSKFADALSMYFKDGLSPEEFTRALLKSICLSSAQGVDILINDLEPRTLKGYRYGDHDITKIAEKISGSLDLGRFSNFVHLDEDAEDSINSLCNKFRTWCPDISPDTYETEIAERFQKIIENAAKPKRKKKLPVVDTTESSELKISSLKNKYGVLLVAEEGSICPNDECSKLLFINENGHLGLNYDVATIDPLLPDTDPNNLIALCPECCARYKLSRNDASIAHMKEIKRSLLENNDDRELLSEQKVQDGVRKVLEKIPKFPRPMNVDLNYDPVPVREKIKPENVSLYLKVQVQVNVYFPAVHETLQEMGREHIIRFKPFCDQVKLTYSNLSEQGYDQPKIYCLMTDWLASSTNGDRDSCEIIISYFIQKCEVFDVITK